MGPPKVRRRSTTTFTNVAIPFSLDNFQKERLENFIDNDLKGGSVSFTWEDPTSDATVNYRLTKEPQFRLVSGDRSRVDRRWVARLDLEIIP